MFKKYILLIITGTIFGSQFLLTKIALHAYTPLEIGMLRIVFGTIAIALLIPLVSKEKMTQKIRWYSYALVAFLEGTLPCVLVPWGQQHVQTGIAAVIISTMPIFAMIFGPFLVKSEKFHWVNLVSIFAGFIGVCVLINPGAMSLGNLLKEIVPELAILLASASWALSLVFIKKMPEVSPFLLTRNILIAATIEIIPIWLIFGHPLQIHFAAVPFLNAALLGIFASGVVYIFYVLLIRFSGVNFAAFSNYLVPIVGGLIAILFLGEKFQINQVIGFLLIVAGLLAQTFHELISNARAKKKAQL